MRCEELSQSVITLTAAFLFSWLTSPQTLAKHRYLESKLGGICRIHWWWEPHKIKLEKGYFSRKLLCNKTSCVVFLTNSYLMSLGAVTFTVADWIFFAFQRVQWSTEILQDLTYRNITDFLVKTYPTLIKGR